MGKINYILRQIIVALIKIYQYLISPFLGHCCRFYPSCSVYAQEAVQSHGMLCGMQLALKRILRCHPWHSGGYDPVPEYENRLKD